LIFFKSNVKIISIFNYSFSTINNKSKYLNLFPSRRVISRSKHRALQESCFIYRRTISPPAVDALIVGILGHEHPFTISSVLPENLLVDRSKWRWTGSFTETGSATWELEGRMDKYFLFCL